MAGFLPKDLNGVGTAPTDDDVFVVQQEGSTEVKKVTYSEIKAGIGPSSTGLEKITENSKSGWRLMGKDPLNYGDLGNNSLCFSDSLGPSTTLGATGKGSVSFGSNTTASGGYSTASGRFSTASGSCTTASGSHSTASGSYSTASGDYSTASGVHSTASEYYSTASGYYSTASGNHSVARGNHSTASGVHSTASGYYSTASGSYSIANGDHTKAINDYSHTEGKWNVGTSTETIHEVGIGVDEANRKNAFELYTNGRVHVPELTIALITDPKCLTTKEFVDAKITNILYKEVDFDGTSGDTEFTISGLDFDKISESKVFVYVDGVKLRSNTHSISNIGAGTDTKITLNTALTADAWVSIEYFIKA